MTTPNQASRNRTVLLCILALVVLVPATAACLTSASPAGIITAVLAVLIARELLRTLRPHPGPSEREGA